MKRRVRRMLAYLLLAVGIGLLVVGVVLEVRENSGIQFYARQPSLILLVLVIAVAMGILIEGVARWKRRARLRPTTATRKVAYGDQLRRRPHLPLGEPEEELSPMFDANRRWRLLRTLLIALAVVWIGWSSALSLIRFLYQRRVDNEATQWSASAEADAGPNWTEENAVSWLHDHGIQKAYRGEASGSGGHYLVVEGYRLIDEGGMLLSPATMQITFLFKLDHRFARVEYHVWPFDLLSLRKTMRRGRPTGGWFRWAKPERTLHYFPEHQ